MIQDFVERWEAKKDELKKKYSEEAPSAYFHIVKDVVSLLSSDDYGSIDPKRIHTIDDGDYQGTLLFVIGANGYQPRTYWYVKVDYGSCSGCDTLEAIQNYSDDNPTEEQVQNYMALALHILQGLKEI